jgi:hypothetical protein
VLSLTQGCYGFFPAEISPCTILLRTDSIAIDHHRFYSVKATEVAIMTIAGAASFFNA